MRIVWLGSRESAWRREIACAIAGDDRVGSLETLSLDAGAERIESSIADADGVVLAVHHFEPLTNRWFDRLGSAVEPARWRAALGPFALVAGRAPFDAMHRQGIPAGDLPAARRWLETLASGEEASAAEPPKRTLIWAPSEERCGVDPEALTCRSNDSTDAAGAALITPRTSGLPCRPDVVIAWIPADLNREERVHLGQLAAAAPFAVRIAVYASTSARARVPFPADATFTWPCDATSIAHAAAELVAERANSPAVDRAA